MKRILLCWFLLTSTLLAAQDPVQIDIPSRIEQVTVFIRGAQVHRTASVRVAAGASELLFKNLSPLLDPTSIQLQTKAGEITVLSVNHHIDFLGKQERPAAFQQMEGRMETLTDSIALTTSQIATLADQESFLKANQSVGGQQTGLNLAELRSVAAYYGEQLRTIRQEQLLLEKRRKKLVDELTRLQQQLKERQADPLQNTAEVIVRINAGQAQDVELTLTYLCSNAGWFPAYDLRARDVQSPVEIVYKAKVYQHTGEDWRQVQLSFSNADPKLSGSMPVLTPYRITDRPVAFHPVAESPDPSIRQVSGRIVEASGEPLIGANILVKGTSVGAITDFEGRFSILLPEGANVLNISYVGYASREIPVTRPNLEVTMEETLSLEEIVVTGLAGRTAGVESRPARIEEEENQLPTTPVEYQTTVAFELDIPFTVPSDGEQYILELGRYRVPAAFEYQSVPKLEAAAFLTARITDWEQLRILAGAANLFFENTYLGQTLLDLRNIADTLTLSLGRDRSIIVDRQPVQEYRRSNLTGNKRIESRTFRILARNAKSQPVSLLVRDQIPLSPSRDIEITAEELAGGLLDEESGEIRWKMTLAPGEQREWRFSYRVRYPAEMRLRLE